MQQEEAKFENLKDIEFDSGRLHDVTVEFSTDPVKLAKALNAFFNKGGACWFSLDDETIEKLRPYVKIEKIE